MRVFCISCFVFLCFPRIGLAERAFPYTLQWKRLVGTPLEGALVRRDSLVFVGGADFKVLALDQWNGLRVWQYRAAGPTRRSMVVQEDLLIFADDWGRVQALDWRTGAERWAMQRLGWGSAGIAIQDSLLYSGGADGWLYALRSSDGTQAWRVRTGSRVPGAPWVQGRRLYTGTRDGQVVAVDARSGARLQSVDAGSRVQAGPTGVKGRLLVACDDGYVRAYRTRDLELLWERRLGAGLRVALLVVKGRLVCAADHGRVYGLDWKNGRLVWERDLREEPSGPPVLGPQGEVLIATQKGRVVALEADSGHLRWDAQVLNHTAMRLQVEGEWLYASGGDGYLYAFVRLGPVENRARALWENWWEVLGSGHKNGYVHQVAHAEKNGERKVWRIREEAVDWSGGFRRAISEILVDRSYRPLSFARRTIEGNQAVQTRGTWVGETVQVEQWLAGRPLRWEIAVEEDVVLPEVALLRLVQEGRAASGLRDSLLVFDYGSLEVRKLYLEFEAMEEQAGSAALKVRMHWADGFSGVEILEWIDPEGRSVRTRVPALGAERVRADAEQARAWAPPAGPRQIRLDHPVKTPGEVEKLVLELPSGLGDVHRLLIEDERQQIEVDAEGCVRLRVQRLEYDGRDAVDLPIRAKDKAPYLAPSLYIQTEDERIQALARQLRGSEINAWKVALRLQQWVYDHMVPRNTNVRFKSSLEVLQEMEGTCSEYTVLFMALCRAAGVPARACVGFLASGTGALVLHIWAQVYVGQWVDMDPSWDESSVDAAHIKTGQGRLMGAELQRLNEPLQHFLVRADTLKLVEYRTGEERFLAAAEELFVEAEEAERHYIDERAQELYHQILLLPWNHRSGKAGVDIGRFHLRRGELEEAVWALERVLELDRAGAAADDALFYLARASEQQDDTIAALARLAQLVEEYPEHDLADDALARLGELYEREQGCERARPYYERLRAEYSQSGWAEVAASALARCGQQGD